ncbi:MAG TPA: TonB-dependent receptor, partial [Chitinophagales bacterium]|nr:TonB-dependent receptor [Chitinophagales bacterium]
KRIFLIYGFDGFWNRPDTQGSVNGKNEDRDNLDEYGIYFQGNYKLHPRFDITFASRLDYNTFNKKVIFSPKLALSYKPGTGQNLRFTFNRAFKNPGTAGYFVDAKQGEIPQGIQVRNIGTPRDGLHYSFANNPYYGGQLLPQFRSPYGTTNNTYYNVGDGSINNAAWNGIKNAIKSQFLMQFGFDPNSSLAALADGLINTLAPATIPNSIEHEVKNLNTTTREFDKNTTWQKTKDIPGLKPTITYSYELGYKGLLFKMLGLSLDVYRTDFKDYIAPVTMTTPTVQFNADQLLDYVGPLILANYNNPDNAIIKSVLDGLLDTRADLGGNGNGSGSDELLSLFKKAVSNLPIGVITTQETNGPNMLLITRNIGDLTIYGVDFGANAYLSKNIVLSTNYSWISRDSVALDDAVFAYIALNSPKHKFNVGLNYNIEKVGLNFGVRFQYNSGFPVNSGNFIGYQKATHDMDLDISYTPKFLKDKFNIAVSIQNLYSHKQQRLIGSPIIGTTGVMKLSYTFL